MDGAGHGDVDVVPDGTPATSTELSARGVVSRSGSEGTRPTDGLDLILDRTTALAALNSARVIAPSSTQARNTNSTRISTS